MKKVETKITWQVGNGPVHDIPDGATVTLESEESTVEAYIYKHEQGGKETSAVRVSRTPR